MNLTRGQYLSIAILALSILGASTSQLTDIFGPSMTKTIVSLSTMLTGFLSGVGVIIGGQSSQLAAVQDMDGVEKIVVNEKANPTLAAMTISPDNSKIEALPSAQSAVEATARTA